MAAHQHNYSSPRLAVRASPTRVKYYIQMRSEAAPVSKAELVKAEGVAVPRGRAAEVEGCKFMEGEGWEEKGAGRRKIPGEEREDKDRRTQREDAEMSLRAVRRVPKKGNYVVWFDLSATFATFPPS